MGRTGQAGAVVIGGGITGCSVAYHLAKRGARVTIVDAIPSKSRADRGTLKTLGELLNQDGDVVMTIRGIGFFGRRPG